MPSQTRQRAATRRGASSLRECYCEQPGGITHGAAPGPLILDRPGQMEGKIGCDALSQPAARLVEGDAVRRVDSTPTPRRPARASPCEPDSSEVCSRLLSLLRPQPLRRGLSDCVDVVQSQFSHKAWDPHSLLDVLPHHLQNGSAPRLTVMLSHPRNAARTGSQIRKSSLSTRAKTLMLAPQATSPSPYHTPI